MIRVYGDINSGNCCKVKLLMSLPDIEHQWSHVDVLGQETRSPSFLAMNPNGKMPVMEIAPGTHLRESNTILNCSRGNRPAGSRGCAARTLT